MDFVDSNDSDNKGDPIENTNFRSNLPSAHPAASKSEHQDFFILVLNNPCKSKVIFSTILGVDMLVSRRV